MFCSDWNTYYSILYSWISSGIKLQSLYSLYTFEHYSPWRFLWEIFFSLFTSVKIISHGISITNIKNNSTNLTKQQKKIKIIGIFCWRAVFTASWEVLKRSRLIHYDKSLNIFFRLFSKKDSPQKEKENV